MPGLLDLQLSMRLIILLHRPFDHSVFWIHSHETIIFTVRGTGHGIPLHSFKGGKKDNSKVTKKINSIRNASAIHVCYTKGLCQALSQQTPSQGHGFCKDLKQAEHSLGTSHSPLAQHFPRPFNLLPLSALLSPTNCTRERKKTNPNPAGGNPCFLAGPEKASQCCTGGPGWFALQGQAAMGKGISTKSRATQSEIGSKGQLCSPSSPAKPVLPASLLYPKQLPSSMQGGENLCALLP